MVSTQASTAGQGGTGMPDGTDSIAAEVTPYVLGAVPLLVPLLLLSAFSDAAVFQTLLWRGNLVALFLGMLPLFLPLLAAGVTYVLVRRFRTDDERRAVKRALLAGASMLPFVPINMALLQLALLPLSLALLPRGRLWVRVVCAAGATLLTLFGVALGVAHWQDNRGPWQQALGRLTVGRVLKALPEEVIKEQGGEPYSVYVVQVDDGGVTVVTHYPAQVQILPHNNLERHACDGKERFTEHSIVSLVARSTIGSVANGATPKCTDLIDQLKTDV
jgi:hypothetical protein